MSDQVSIGEAVNRVARLMRRLADARLGPLGLAAGYLPVLTALEDGGLLSQKALTERAGIEQPTMAATLTRMERDGIIVRKTDPADRRSSLFQLTKPTLDRIPRIRKTIAKLNVEALGGLTKNDQDTLRALLMAVGSNVERLLEP